MPPKTNKITKSATARNDGSNSSSDKKDSKSQSNDPRLKSILNLIATQLPPIQEVIIHYAKAMLDKTRALKSRQATLAKFRKTIPNKPNTANGTSTPSSSFYVPKSARVKINLTYSNALKNETEIKDLEEELKESISIFGARVACIFERTAKLEEIQEKTSRLHTFLNYCHKLIQGFVIIARRRSDLETNLSTETLEKWCLLVLLRNLKTTSVSGLHIFEQYLEVDYKEAKENFTKLFLPNYQPAETEDEAENDIFYKKGSKEEASFVCSVTEQVEGLIIPTTFKLQLELDKQEETKTITSLIEAKFKRDETLTATEATALAIHDVTPSNQNNMEQHIKKLIDEAIRKKLSKSATTSLSPSTLTPPQNKRKNSHGSKKPQTSLPKNKGGEENVSFRYHMSDNDNNQEEEEEEENQHQQTKKQKKQNQEQQEQRTPRTTNRNPNKNKNKNETQEGKRKDPRKEN